MEMVKALKEQFLSLVQGQMSNIEHVDAHELGEVMDMAKDCAELEKLCEEAKYYKKITEAMEKSGKEEHHHYYTTIRDMDRDMGRMYMPYTDDYAPMEYSRARDSKGRFMYTDRSASAQHNNYTMDMHNNRGDSRDYTEREMPFEMRDSREGRSGMSRRTYMESKEMHKDKTVKIKDLENYMKELGDDIVEMIKDASPEEKQILEKKIAALANKISQVNG